MHHEMKIAFNEETRSFGIIDSIKGIFSPSKKMDKKVVVFNALESLVEGGVDFNDIVSFPDLVRCKPADFYEHDFICFPVKYCEESKDHVVRKWLDKDEIKFLSDVRKYLVKIEKKAPLVKKRGTLVYDADILKESQPELSKDIEGAGYNQAYELNGMYCLVGKDKKDYVFISVDDVVKWMTSDLAFPKSTILEVVDIPRLEGRHKSSPQWLQEKLDSYNKIREERGLSETEFPGVKIRTKSHYPHNGKR